MIIHKLRQSAEHPDFAISPWRPLLVRPDPTGHEHNTISLAAVSALWNHDVADRVRLLARRDELFITLNWRSPGVPFLRYSTIHRLTMDDVPAVTFARGFGFLPMVRSLVAPPWFLRTANTAAICSATVLVPSQTMRNTDPIYGTVAYIAAAVWCLTIPVVFFSHLNKEGIANRKTLYVTLTIIVAINLTAIALKEVSLSEAFLRYGALAMDISAFTVGALLQQRREPVGTGGILEALV